jgi:hypothetical protein
LPFFDEPETFWRFELAFFILSGPGDGVDVEDKVRVLMFPARKAEGTVPEVGKKVVEKGAFFGD